MLDTQIVDAVRESLEIRVVGLSGSLRAPSATRMAVQYALKGAEEEGAKVQVMDLAAYNLPYWGLEREERNVKSVERVRSELRASEGILLGPPQTHGSLSGVS